MLLAALLAVFFCTTPVSAQAPPFPDENWARMSLSDGFSGLGPGGVSVLAEDGAGNLYAGGKFSAAGNVGANGVAKWDGTAWSALGSGMNGTVVSLAVSGTNVYAGGTFTVAGGVPAFHIAKWDGAAWSALDGGVNDISDTYGRDWEVVSVVATATAVYVDIYDDPFLGEHRTWKWNGSTWSEIGSYRTFLFLIGEDLYAAEDGGGAVYRWNGSSWITVVSNNDIDGEISALVSRAGVTHALINSYSGNNHEIMRLEGSAWVTVCPAFPGTGYSDERIMVAGGQIYQSWNFNSINPHRGIARWTGAAWELLGSGLAIPSGDPGEVNGLAMMGTTLVAAGKFSTAGGAPAENIAAWSGTVWSAMPSLPAGSSQMQGVIKAVAVDGDDIYVTGSFTASGNVASQGVMKWSHGSWTPLGTLFPGPSYWGADLQALMVWNGSLYAGGSFFLDSSMTASSSLVRWNGAEWEAVAGAPAGSVNALAVFGGKLYAGGQFSTAGGNAAINIARWNGTAWSALGTGVRFAVSGNIEPSVNSLCVHGGSLYVGGSFDRAGNTLVQNIARWDGSAWTGLGAGLSFTQQNEYSYGSVDCMVSAGGLLYAGGWFDRADDQPVKNIARWNGTAWQTMSGGPQLRVRALTFANGLLYAGGDFVQAFVGTSQPLTPLAASHIIRWDGTSWSAMGSGVGGNVHAMALNADGQLILGGEFQSAGPVFSPLIAAAYINGRPGIQVVKSPGLVVADGSTVNFGNVPASTSKMLNFTVTNTGTAALNDLSVNALSGVYSLGGTLPATLAPGASASFTVTFTAPPVTAAPYNLSAYNQNLQITTNIIGSEGVFDLAFRATGNPQFIPDMLDTTFGTGGKVITPVSTTGTLNDEAMAVAIGRSGDIYVAGTTQNAGTGADILLLRYHADGTLDAGFGTGGRATAAIGSGSTSDQGRAMALRPDGRIVVAGLSGGDMGVAVFTSDGDLDTSFSNDGKTTVSFTSGFTTLPSGVNALALDADGNLVLAGFVENATTSTDFAVCRLTEAGVLDTTFGTGGKKVIAASTGARADAANAVAIGGTRTTGTVIYMAGYATTAATGTDFCLVTISPTGAATNVKTHFGGNEAAYGMKLIPADAFNPSERLLLAGTSNGGQALARYLSTGTLDINFGSAGKLTTTSGELALALALDLSDRAITAGTVGGNSGDFAVSRFTETAPDNTFTPGGILPVSIGPKQDIAYAVAVQSDGRIIAVGTTKTAAGDTDVALIRLGSALTPLSAWRQLYFGSPDNTGNGADGSDPDNDGLTNLTEYAFGLTPTEPDSGSLTSWQRSASSTFITFPAQPGVTYIAEKSTTLAAGSWLPLANTGGGNVRLFAVPDEGPRLYLRVRVTNP